MRFHVRPQHGVHPGLIPATAKAFIIGDHVLIELSVNAFLGRRDKFRLVHPVIAAHLLPYGIMLARRIDLFVRHLPHGVPIGLRGLLARDISVATL